MNPIKRSFDPEETSDIKPDRVLTSKEAEEDYKIQLAMLAEANKKREEAEKGKSSKSWGNDSEEVSFEELMRGSTRKIGMQKVRGCCNQAIKDELKYAWIDTCCINKESSKELDEAINSMFQWYQRAAVCYTYMADVPHGQDIWEPKSNFYSSSWFTRGWTLQELIAPGEVRFYDQTWSLIGTKEDLASEIEDITNIPRRFLLGWVDFHQASVAQRMSWASKRKTKREEDIAYCLLGIFNVTMPMIYGEGHKAFERLQLKIMEQTTDDSILAWGVKVQGMESESHSHPGDGCMSAGIFATSPTDFAKCGRIVPKLLDSTCINTFAVSGGYIRISLKLQSSESGVTYGLLNCGLERNSDGVIAIPLHCTSSLATVSEYIRPQGYGPILLDNSPADQKTQEVRIRVDRQVRPFQAIGRRIWLHIDGHQKLKLHLKEVWPPLKWDKGRALVAEMNGSGQTCRQKHLARFTTRAERGRDIIVVLNFNIDARGESADCYTIAAPQICGLNAIGEILEYMQPEHLRDKVMDNGNIAVKVDVQKDDVAQGAIFLLRLARTKDRPPPDANPYQHISKAIKVRRFMANVLQEEFGRSALEKATEDQAAAAKSFESLTNALSAIEEKERQIAEERKIIEAEMKEASDTMSTSGAFIRNNRRLLDQLTIQKEKDKEGLDKTEKTHGPGNWFETVIQGQLDKQKSLLGTDPPEGSDTGSQQATGLVNSKQVMAGYVPLLWAAANGQEYAAGLLLEKGADIEVKDPDNGNTALIFASKYGHNDMVHLLLKHGASLKARNINGDTALAVAAYHGLDTTAGLLIERGADIEARSNNQSTPLAIAARRGCNDVVKLLLDNGADIEARNKWRDTPLSRASSYGHEGIVKTLLDAGAKVLVRNKKGFTPILLAKTHGHEGTLILLQAKYRVDPLPDPPPKTKNTHKPQRASPPMKDLEDTYEPILHPRVARLKKRKQDEEGFQNAIFPPEAAPKQKRSRIEKSVWKQHEMSTAEQCRLSDIRRKAEEEARRKKNPSIHQVQDQLEAHDFATWLIDRFVSQGWMKMSDYEGPTTHEPRRLTPDWT
ncbi:hypothetical protein F53441_6518 [Fusarium austroafricanum]|uniref:Heterokaryon incompatibility domain-containing protein n=1 Tax=Fusarium austroafricanum TaxID=2364996 RepID=A0A8H4KIM7_9HYPO|nr:hypothetical protein F53441_6518 [Fusarium austroafricanum]